MKEVFIFYSGEKNPDLPQMYGEGIAYLHQYRIKSRFVDVIRNPEMAEKFKIMATPIVIIRRMGKEYRYLGITKGLKELLENDLYGKSVLYLSGFREGRIMGKSIKSLKRELIEEFLAGVLEERDVCRVKITEFNIKENKIGIRLGSKSIKSCQELLPLFGGIFTQALNENIIFREKTHRGESGDCVFGSV